ncbi:hypothetical protein ECA3980 [Pectobacterium atrosepticum SCRI1043]|uniref:Uncharacterized protein n=1 Tax=Pectobacterium atrosepticum (strain SCRI 1043 / ATCC BAA-672) TaxID=218491 RepID=Q6D021_PECAS|nr:hypothetical protein ECA3980 [Pectobacterium atrosepticum SCRI1043]
MLDVHQDESGDNPEDSASVVDRVKAEFHRISASLPLGYHQRITVPPISYLGDAPLLACTPSVQVRC